MSKVSILIPVYNTEKYLKKCLDSVINQTLKDIEIIIVNDGSKDNSQKIIEEYAQKDKRIKYYKQENLGLGATRNKGIELATGEYIAFLDSDDWVEQEYYELMYKEAIKSKCDMVISDYFVDTVNKTSIYQNKYDKVDKLYYIKEVIMRNTSGFSWNKLYKRKLIIDNNLRFVTRDEFENIEDQNFTIKMLFLSNKISFFNKPLIHYIIRENSIVNSYQKELVDNGIKFYRDIYKFLDENNADISMYKALDIGILKHICQILSNECKPTNKKSINQRIVEYKRICNIEEYKDILNTFKKDNLSEKNYHKYLTKEQRLELNLLINNKINTLYFIKYIRIMSIILRVKFNKG